MTDAVTVMSESLASRLVERGVASRSRLVVIPNAVELGRYAEDECRAETRRTLGVDDGEFVWLAAGRLAAEKDFPALLRASRRLGSGGRGCSSRGMGRCAGSSRGL